MLPVSEYIGDSEKKKKKSMIFEQELFPTQRHFSLRKRIEVTMTSAMQGKPPLEVSPSARLSLVSPLAFALPSAPSAESLLLRTGV